MPNAGINAVLRGGQVGTIARNLKLTLPTSYQVIQRNGSHQANIAIVGNATARLPKVIEADFNGGGYSTISNGLSRGNFNLSLNAQAQGTGTLTIRDKNNTSDSITVTHVNIGIVLLMFGQSNMGEQADATYAPTNTTYDCNIFNGSYNYNLWGPAANRVANFWPILSDAIMNSENCPVGFLAAAVGGTQVEDWQTNASYVFAGQGFGEFGVGQHLYSRILSMIQYCGCGTVEEALWWQGEANVPPGDSANTYQTQLTNIVNQLHTDVGCKTMPCKIEQVTDSGHVNIDVTKVNTGIQQCWDSGGNFDIGPDISGITADGLFGGVYVHIVNAANTNAVGILWDIALIKAKGWTPSKVTSGLVVEHRSDTGVTLATNNVTHWVDTINSIDAAQATALQQPTLATSIQNGKPGILFDGTITALDWASGLSLFKNVTGISFSIACKPTGFNGALMGKMVFINQGTSQAAHRWAANFTAGSSPVSRGISSRCLDTDGTTTVVTGATYATGAEICTYITDYTGDGTHRLDSVYRNGVQVLAPTNGGTSGTVSNTDALAINYGGANNGGGTHASIMTGYLFHLNGYNRALTQYEALKNSAYHNFIYAIY